MAKRKDEAPTPEDLDGVVNEEEQGSEEQDADLINKFVAGHATDEQAEIEKAIKSQDKVSIIIHNQDGPGGDKPVFVGANGVGYHIPREVWVEVPMIVLNVLKSAEETRYYREEVDGRQVGDIKEKQIRRFSFSHK